MGSQPIGMELAGEVTYPVIETYSIGLMFVCANLISIPVNLLIVYFIQEDINMMVA